MRLEITRRADLAMRALVTLSAADRMKAVELAGALGTTVGFVPQIVGPLVKAGWVRSDPGPSGGYAATVDLGTVSVLQVVETIDGPTDTGRCVVADRTCASGATCALHSAWAIARRHLVESLAATPLTSIPAASIPAASIPAASIPATSIPATSITATSITGGLPE